MEQKKRIFISLGILIGLIAIFFVVTSIVSTTSNTPKYSGLLVSDGTGGTEFENCLGNQDINLFINIEKSEDALVNTRVSDYLQYFKIQNCYSNKQPCINYNIKEFPTWVINGKSYVGDISVDLLGEYTGCGSQ